MISQSHLSALFFTGLFSTAFLQAQEMEPRAYSNAPVGMNFAVLGYEYSTGELLLDGASPIKDAEITTHGVALAYARSLNLFGVHAWIAATHGHSRLTLIKLKFKKAAPVVSTNAALFVLA